MSTTQELVDRLRTFNIPACVEAADRLEELDGDDVLRWGSVNEHCEAPDGSVWRHITFNGEQYTIPFEVSHLLDLRRNKIDELERENARLREAIFWACGAVGDFPGSGDRSRGNFFWRKELRERAGITDEELNARAALAGSGEK